MDLIRKIKIPLFPQWLYNYKINIQKLKMKESRFPNHLYTIKYDDGKGDRCVGHYITMERATEYLNIFVSRLNTLGDWEKRDEQTWEM